MLVTVWALKFCLVDFTLALGITFKYFRVVVLTSVWPPSARSRPRPLSRTSTKDNRSTYNIMMLLVFLGYLLQVQNILLLLYHY